MPVVGRIIIIIIIITINVVNWQSELLSRWTKSLVVFGPSLSSEFGSDWGEYFFRLGFHFHRLSSFYHFMIPAAY